MNNISIGILGVQGAFLEHKNVLDKLQISCKIVKIPEDLDNIDGLILPGGESSVMSRFIKTTGLYKSLYDFIIVKKKPVLGTCAGSILLSKTVVENKKIIEGLFPVLDISIERNSYGSHYSSFTTPLLLDESLHVIDKHNDNSFFKGIFIRAPKILEVKNVQVLVTHDNNPVLLKNKQILISTFHPELTNDERIHLIFLNLIKKTTH